MDSLKKRIARLFGQRDTALRALPQGEQVERILKDIARLDKMTHYTLTHTAEDLAALGEEAADPLILAMMNSRSRFVQQVAAEALGELQATAAVTSLIELLRIENFEVAVSAARALGKIGDPRAKEALEFAAEYGTDRVSIAAREALYNIQFSGH
jgi:HEAT repeat protein